MAVQEELRPHFGGNRRNLVASHSNRANIKKAHSLGVSDNQFSLSGCLRFLHLEALQWQS